MQRTLWCSAVFKAMNFNAPSITDINPTRNNVKNITRSALKPTWNHKPNVKQRLLSPSLDWGPQIPPTMSPDTKYTRHETSSLGRFSAATTVEIANQGCPCQVQQQCCFMWGLAFIGGLWFSDLHLQFYCGSGFALCCTLLRNFALFCALLRSFARFCTHLSSFALMCALLRSSACFCVRLHLERPRLGTSDQDRNCNFDRAIWYTKVSAQLPYMSHDAILSLHPLEPKLLWQCDTWWRASYRPCRTLRANPRREPKLQE